MRELTLIGIGTGNPDHLTFEGARAIQRAETILIPRKGDQKSDLADLRRQIIDTVAPDCAAKIIEFDLPTRAADGDYLNNVDLWHDAIAEAWKAAAGTAETAALLIWGDPSLYDSSLRIASRLTPYPKIKVIAGITSLQALTAAHAIPINDIGAPFVVATGRQLRDHGWPKDADTAVFMLDGNCAFQTLALADYDIWWGAYLGMENQVIRSGPLADVCADIIETRAQARADHGWIMDAYLLRRRT
ncbi:precorrin-6A synthase (deacetylating) [Pseudosulfitobacter sp. SM2401]|uniref:precorrin-6A synthase (deacetylating) n=1 Tax=Pseudosulfitobacter sp. SM2401 TaxID=3350098 RepID=UPI0036F437E7